VVDDDRWPRFHVAVGRRSRLRKPGDHTAAHRRKWAAEHPSHSNGASNAGPGVIQIHQGGQRRAVADLALDGLIGRGLRRPTWRRLARAPRTSSGVGLGSPMRALELHDTLGSGQGGAFLSQRFPAKSNKGSARGGIGRAEIRHTGE